VRATTLLGVTLGLLIGCGVLGLGGFGFVVYFAAWCGDVFDHLSPSVGRVAMLVGLPLGLGLYAAVWALLGVAALRWFSGFRKRRQHGAA
jgi:hypothetical protein